MSLSVSIPPFYTEDVSQLSFVLRNSVPNAPASPHLAFEASERLHLREDAELWRGKLSPGKDGSPADVVCKFTYGRDGLERQEHEAHIYDKLEHLQGKCVPYRYGHFIGDSAEGSTSCLVLEYCGESLSRMLQCDDPTFRDAIIDAVNAIHEAGVEHLDLEARNILNDNGRPVIIDFEVAQDHVCERGLPMVRGAIQPSWHLFNCPELYHLCRNSNFWRPSLFIDRALRILTLIDFCALGRILFATAYHDIELAKDAHKLAARAPRNWPPDFALQKAYHAIIKHAKVWYPEQYEPWIARINANKASQTASDKDPAAAAVGMPADGC